MTPGSYRILVVEDNDSDFELYQKFLSSSEFEKWELLRVRTVADGSQALKEKEFGLLLLDFKLPDGDILTFLSETDKLLKTSYIPSIVLSGFGDEKTAVDVIKNGATNYLSKDHLSKEVFINAVRYALSTGDMIRQIARNKEELIEAKEKAETASRYKSEFIANISHEIRTPMNSVVGLASLLQSCTTSPEQQEYVQGIVTAGESLLTIISDLIDISKIESGQLSLREEETDFYQLSSEVCDMFSDPLSVKNLELMTYVDVHVPIVISDAVRIRQLLINLIGNAIRFTDKGFISLFIKGKDLDYNKITVEIDVADTGAGISPEEQKRLFELFSRADHGPGSSTLSQGSGLGLTICQTLCHLMGGEISVKSEPGKGSVFTIELSLPVSYSKNPHFQKVKELKGKEVYVVSSEMTGQNFLFQQLDNWGMRWKLFDTAKSLKEGLEKSFEISHQPDFLLVDYLLTDSGGLRLLEELHQQNSLKNIKDILISQGTRGVRGIYEESKRAGVYALLNKPISPWKLLKILDQSEVESPKNSAGPSDMAIEPEFEKRHKILLVDDNLGNQKLGKRLIEKCGHIPVIAENGLKALEAVKHESFCIIYMDCQMPVMDGFESTVEIRKHEIANGLPRTPIIALTAGVLSDYQDRCYVVGMDDFLSKPVNLKTFKQSLLKWIAKAAQNGTGGDKAAGDTAKTAEQTNVTDLEMIRSFSKNQSSEFVQGIAYLFHKSSSRELELLKTYTEKNILRKAERAAFSLGQLSQDLGAEKLGKICHDLEKTCYRNHDKGIQQLVNDAETELKKIWNLLGEFSGKVL